MEDNIKIPIIVISIILGLVIFAILFWNFYIIPTLKIHLRSGIEKGVSPFVRLLVYCFGTHK